VRGGSSADPADRPGLAAFTAALLDDGAGTLDGPGLADVLARIGAEADIEVWPDATVVTITTLARHVSRAASLLADLVMRPRLATDDIERVRGLRLDRLRQMRAQAASLADRALTRAIYGRHPYGHPGIGDPDAVRATTADDIRGFHAHGYQARATTLVVAGDLDTAEAIALAEAAFGAWVPGPMNGAGPRVVNAPEGRGRVLVVARPGASQSELRVGQVSAARSTPDYHALILWNAVLGGQFVSRLNLNLRRRRLHLRRALGFRFRRDRGPFSIHTSVHDGHGGCDERILREVRDAVHASRHPRGTRRASGCGSGIRAASKPRSRCAIAQMSLHDIGPDHFEQFVPR
jgi:zinc protease